MSREQIGEVVRSKQHFYNAMLLAGYVLPAVSQGIISIKFMHQVRSREVWMPKGEDISVCRQVPYPPTNDMIVDLITVAAGSQVGRNGWTEENLGPVHALVERVQKKSADKSWLLKLLYYFDPECEVFSKGYRYVRPRNKLHPERMEVFGNDDGFWNDLPPLQPNEMRGRQMRMSKQDK